MKFSLNQFLMAISLALDFVEIDIRGRSTNHGKRVAYASLRIAEKMGFKNKDLYDIVSLAILHDNGICEASSNSLKGEINEEEHRIDHCIIGENNIVNYPFLKKRKNIIRYHHEAYDGSGFYRLKGSEIPLISQIIFFNDYLENKFELDKIDANNRREICNFVKEMGGKIFNPEICSIFLEILNNESFILDLKNNFIDMALNSRMNEFYLDLSLEEILNITDVFSRIIDSKSKFTRRHSKGIAEKAATMADYYEYDKEQKIKLIIAANLHDLGKLAIPNSILDSPKKLTEDEFYMIKSHTYYTRAALSQINGFEDITEWASNHHEKLNGFGYPYGKNGDELDFNSRLMGCIDIYQALTEERPYRKPLEHDTVMSIMNDMVQGGYIDKIIVKDIDFVFSK
ncbi:HD-GYP domain-containing protein [Clostridium guangxiense]|uniref:HD-GYP domain-containing protein n=1 Tax=Clostridium guangxiense TaxID=1662055 RepID=UPI001E3249B1|nr:HD domain-containing phosphohydrolase [Clostridium guangxiense]MCD2347095.1 HD domain-containing protein [Clostridium guangxiense]